MGGKMQHLSNTALRLFSVLKQCITCFGQGMLEQETNTLPQAFTLVLCMCVLQSHCISHRAEAVSFFFMTFT